MYPRVAEAVRAGLLPFIYGRTTRMDVEDVSRLLAWVVLALRSHTLVSWTVVTAMRGAFADAQKSPQYREFTKLPLFHYWCEMAGNFEYRVQALEAWEATRCHWIAVCENSTVICPHCLFAFANSPRSAARQDGNLNAVRVARAGYSGVMIHQFTLERDVR
jgi:hypothetical protein